MDTSRLKRKASDEFNRRTGQAAMLPANRRPTWQTALMYFAGGMALTWLAAFFLDGGRGAERRQMVVDGVRDLRDTAQGTMAQIKDTTDSPGRAAV